MTQAPDSEDGPKLGVVIAPDTLAEASSLFAALLSGGFHPVMDYDRPTPGVGGTQTLANYPILAPLEELREAQGFVRGLRLGQPAEPPRPRSMFDPGLSDRPVGPLPPWKLNETVGKALGVLGAMVVLVAGLVILVEMLQYLIGLRGH